VRKVGGTRNVREWMGLEMHGGGRGARNVREWVGLEMHGGEWVGLGM